MSKTKLAPQSAVVAVVVALGAAATAAAGGGLSVGAILPGDDSPTPPEYRQTDETVVALGSAAGIGRWRIVSYRSPELVDGGEVLQPEGLPCLKLVLSGPADGDPLATRSYCGERGAGGLEAATLPVERSGRVSTLLFGQAPESAAEVHVADSSGRRASADLHEGPASLAGDFWIHVQPPAEPAERTWVEWAGSDGTRHGERVDLSLELRQPMDPVRVGAIR